MTKRVLPILALSLLACDRAASRRAAPPRDTSSGATPATSPRTAAALPCAAPAGGLRLTPDTIAGLPTRETIEALRRRCASARLDSVGMGGYAAAALRFDFPGGTVWAIQSDYEDTLRPAKRPTSWAASGDSLRFASGELVPRTAGGLRRLDSAGAVILDSGDDTEGSYAVLCRHPEVQIIFGWALAVRPDTGLTRLSRTTALAPLWRIAPTDTLSYWRVDVGPSGDDTAIRKFCAPLLHRSADTATGASRAAAPSSDSAPPTLADFSFRRDVGVAQHARDTTTCLTIANADLAVGDVVFLVSPSSEGPQRVAAAPIDARRASPCTEPGDEWGSVSIEHASFYTVRPVRGRTSGDPWIGVRASAPLRVERGVVTGDLDGDGRPERFTQCTSREGVHLRITTRVDGREVERWHEYFYVPYDLEPDCPGSRDSGGR